MREGADAARVVERRRPERQSRQLRPRQSGIEAILEVSIDECGIGRDVGPAEGTLRADARQQEIVGMRFVQIVVAFVGTQILIVVLGII